MSKILFLRMLLIAHAQGFIRALCFKFLRFVNFILLRDFPTASDAGIRWVDKILGDTLSGLSKPLDRLGTFEELYLHTTITLIPNPNLNPKPNPFLNLSPSPKTNTALETI